MESEILNDKRTIQSVGTVPENDATSHWRTGYRNCQKIEAYGEPGPHCDLPWIRITINGQVRIRLPASAVEITYAKPELEGGSGGDE